MPKEDKAKVKMTVIQFETESDNATLQENVRAITNTLARALAPQPRVIQAPPQLPNGNGNNGDNGKHPEQGSLFDNSDDADAIDGEVTPITSKPKAKSNGAPKYATPKPIDLDLTSGDVPLKTFIEQKKPEGDIKRYLVIAHWFKEFRGVNEITKDHAYTCYRVMGWSDVPKDVGGPFRQMKKKQYGWMNSGSGNGLYAINHIGESVVNKMG